MTDIDHLVAAITAAAKAYYRGEDSGLTDEQFDELREELRLIQANHPLLVMVGHGFTAGNTLKKVALSTRMGSLDNCFNEADIGKWVNRVTRMCTDLGLALPKNVVVEPKYDGLSVQITYRGGVLHQAATRGDGDIGEDVTASVRKAKGVPLTIPETELVIDVRGEMVVTKADFAAHFAPRGDSNARSSAAGTTRRTDGELAQYLTFMPFDANPVGSTAPDARFVSERMMLDTLRDWGFDPPDTVLVPFALDKITEVWQLAGRARDGLDYLADGCVVKVNSRKTAVALGWADTCPRGAFAGKWKGGMVAQAEVIGIEHSVGRTGIITPVALIKPTQCGGVVVSNASLMNWDEVDRIEAASFPDGGKGTLGIGSVVQIERAGEVIPRVLKVLKACTPLPGNAFGRPERCPSCNTQTIVDGPRQRCPNADCPAQAFRWVKNWIAKRDIMHLGDATLDALMAIGGPVSNPSDLYVLTLDQLKAACGGYTMAKKIAAQLEKSRDCTVTQLFGAVGIEGIGMVESEKVVEHLAAQDVATVLRASEDDFVAALGPARGSWFAKGVAHLQHQIRALEAVLRVTKPAPKVKGKVTPEWDGKTFCITGATELPREALIKIIVDAGGVWKSSVSKNCTYLVIADPDSTSNKAKDARALGATLLSEAQALDMAKYA